MKQLTVAILFAILLTACGQLTDDGTGLMFKTADPRLNIGVRLLPPAVIPAEEVGEVLPDPVPEPPCEVIKVNRSKDGTFVYHMPGGAYYDQVRIDESKGEFFACSEQEAIDAGARKALR